MSWKIIVGEVTGCQGASHGIVRCSPKTSRMAPMLPRQSAQSAHAGTTNLLLKGLLVHLRVLHPPVDEDVHIKVFEQVGLVRQAMELSANVKGLGMGAGTLPLRPEPKGDSTH